MKYVLNYFLSAIAITILLTACEKDENRITLESGTPPVLTATKLSGYTKTLLQADSNKPYMKLAWTNPNYRFTTGVNSHNVNYVLQIDTTGSGFTNPNKKEISFGSLLDSTFTVRAFNSLLANTLENIPHNFEIRIKASIGASGSAALYSNIIKDTLTPYLDVAVPIPPTGQLYITGSAVASDWTNNPPASQKFTKVSNVEYYIIVPLVADKEYKFLSTPNNWQPQYGTTNATGTQLGGTMGFNMGLPGQSDPASIKSPGTGGNYKITANFKTGEYKVEKQ